MSLNLKDVSGELDGISPLILGGAVFNTQYNTDPEALPICELLEAGFKLGINAIDTSPYYGPSEELLGCALKRLTEDGKIHRKNYYICTKVGRLQLDDFDYSAKWVETSIRRSLERFHTDYLDVVFLHDVEFKTIDESVEALETLMKLKQQGIIKWVGISGYPVKYIYELANIVKDNKNVGKLDLVMSYSNMCLQNTILEDYYQSFLDTSGVKLVNNASILSMSLLRYQETKSFHPASEKLKDRCAELAIMLKEKYGCNLAELATRFAIRKWTEKKGRTVLGVSNLPELNAAWEQYRLVLDHSLDEKDAALVELSQSFLGDHLNETWKSGLDHH